jgi:HAD superfamily hydrolase (TIGR01549 family)
LGNVSWTPRGLLFDLFGTLVFFEPGRLPRARAGGVERPRTISNLEELLGRLSPPPTPEALIESLRSVSASFVENAGTTYAELSSPERFRLALVALGVAGDIAEVGRELSRQHMRGLSEAVVCPPDRLTLLESLSARFRIALVSNFDHGPTAHELLARHGLRGHFRSVVVSDDLGIRKPHARMFLSACEGLGLAPGDCLHIGDSHPADVLGATQAGVPALWVDATASPIAPAIGRIMDVRELPDWLESRAQR